jgi:serine/threonine protein kinase
MIIFSMNSELYNSDEYISDDESTVNLETQILNNRYICLMFLSNGSFSSVWLVYDIIDFNLKSAKIYNKSPDEFNNEKQIFERINTDNKNIVECFDIFEEEGLMVIVTELLGISLLDIMNDMNSNKYTLFTPNIKYMFYQILNGMNELHSKGVIHADIKPDNILLNILPNNIKIASSFISKLNILEVYNQIQSQLMPEDFDSFNRNKKKMVKRKIKQKTYKLIRDYLFKKIDFSSIQKLERNYDVDRILEHKFILKIIDFSNSELEDHISQNELYIRCYRPLENIINIDYNKKSEIWAIGCLFYEMITGLPLFQIKRYNTETETNKNHIYTILKTFKHQSYTEIIRASDFYDIFFINDELKNKPRYSVLDFKEKLIHNSNIEIDIDEMNQFLLCFFVYNINLRPDCKILLNHHFFNR